MSLKGGGGSSSGSGGGGGGLPSTFVSKTANYTAAKNAFVLADASGGAFTVTPPATPAAGDLFAVKKTDSSANAVNVSGTIDGDAAGASISAQGYGAVFEWSGSEWKIASTFLAGGGSIGGDTAPTDIFIATTGSDTTGNGTSGSPYSTFAKALSVLPVVLGIPHTIHVADGTYAEPINISSLQNIYGNMLTVTGNTTTPANVKFTGTVSGPWIWEKQLTLSSTARVFGNVYVLFQGITLQGNGTATDGLLVQAGPAGRVIWDRCNIQTSSGTYSSAVQMNRGCIEFRGNCTIQNWTANGVVAGESSMMFYGSAGTLTITGPGTSGIGVHLAYHSKWIISTDSVIFNITGVQYGFQLGLHCEFQHQGNTSSITVNNASTPGSSAGIMLTDLCTWSSVAPVTLNHLSVQANLSSICYAEATGGVTATNIGGAAAVTQNSVIGAGFV